MTIEDLDRRLTAVEKAVQTEKNIIDAVSKIVAESATRTEKRFAQVEKRIAEAETNLTAVVEKRLTEAEQRLGDVVSSAARLMAESVNAKFDEVMVALDKLANPPK
jgi:lipopolysaccharide biosynthesis regulator YciM